MPTYHRPPPQQHHHQQQYNQAHYAQAPPPQVFRAPQQPRAAPHGADPQLWRWFETVDTDRSGEISAEELRQALVNGDWSPFDLDTVKMLMGIFDTDRSGNIDFSEFTGLWKYINDWQSVFRHFDTDRSGTIDGNELHRALTNFGYALSPSILTLIEAKYASPPTATGQNGGITFDRFVRACVVIKTLTESFQRADTDGDGWIQVNYDQFLTMVLTAP